MNISNTKPNPAPQPPLADRVAYSMADAAKATGIPRRTLDDARSRGEFPAVKRCGRYMVTRANLLRWLAGE